MADKMAKPLFLPFGVLLSGCALSLIGFFPHNYQVMFIAAMLCGIGIAAFHPEGARMANRLSGKKKGSSMSMFTVGGTIGIAIGPLVATPAILYLGLRGSVVLAVPAITIWVMLSFLYPRMRSFAEDEEKNKEKPKEELKNEWLKFLWLSVAITCRSIIAHSLNTFLPLYWISVLHQSKALSGMLITYMTLIGTVVIVLSGHLADRFGVNRIIKAGWILLIPALFSLTYIKNPILAMVVLVPLVSGNYLINTPLIVLGQQYLPKSVGFASGITLGLGVSIGGVAAPLLGAYADLHGLAAAFKLLSILPVLGIIVAFTTKPPARS
jgi:FSR family fosmidomycin resistance protein-like MFS transporter